MGMREGLGRLDLAEVAAMAHAAEQMANNALLAIEGHLEECRKDNEANARQHEATQRQLDKADQDRQALRNELAQQNKDLNAMMWKVAIAVMATLFTTVIGITIGVIAFIAAKVFGGP